MKLKDYILEYVSSGRRKFSRKSIPISIDKNITLKEFIELIEELGYVEKDNSIELFTKGKKDRYAIRTMSNGVTRVLVKNMDKSDTVYMRVTFVKDKDISSTFVFLDGEGDVDIEPTDLDSLEKYLTGL